jgi:hypothetical protein
MTDRDASVRNTVIGDLAPGSAVTQLGHIGAADVEGPVENTIVGDVSEHATVIQAGVLGDTAP